MKKNVYIIISSVIMLLFAAGCSGQKNENSNQISDAAVDTEITQNEKLQASYDDTVKSEEKAKDIVYDKGDDAEMIKEAKCSLHIFLQQGLLRNLLNMQQK